MKLTVVNTKRNNKIRISEAVVSIRFFLLLTYKELKIQSQMFMAKEIDSCALLFGVTDFVLKIKYNLLSIPHSVSRLFWYNSRKLP